MNGIQINKLFRQLICGNDSITALVKKSNIQPMVLAPSEFPFISFMHGEVVPNYSKASRVVDEMEESIAIVSDKYEEAIEIAQMIREQFEFKQYDDKEIYIPLFEITSIREDSISHSYFVEIVFKFEIQTKN